MISTLVFQFKFNLMVSQQKTNGGGRGGGGGGEVLHQ